MAYQLGLDAVTYSVLIPFGIAWVMLALGILLIFLSPLILGWFEFRQHKRGARRPVLHMKRGHHV